MNTIEINEVLENDPYTKLIYGGCLALDEFEQCALDKILYVVNLSESWSETGGTHWVTIINMPPISTLYANSFGDPPPPEILNHLLRKNKIVSYTNKQYQSPLSQVS